MNDTCICDNVPKVWRLTGVTRTLRLRIFNPDGTPLDLTGRTVAVTIARDNSEFSYAPGFVIEGDDGNVVKFEWPAAKQGAGDYTINVTTTDGSGNVDRVNWHGPTGIRLVDFSFMVRGEDALGVTSEANIGLDGTFTMNGTGMSAYDEWLAEGHTGTPEDFIVWLRQPATDAASAAEAQMGQIQERADADHTRAGNDHTTAGQDHTRAGNDHTTATDDHRIAAADHSTATDDHTLAASDHVTAAEDHRVAGIDHGTAADDHTRAGQDHTQAGSDHTRAGEDHNRAGDDHQTASSDHTRAGEDHTTAGSDHTRAGEDHTQAGNDHTRAEADHGIAADDHTQATADHAVMAGYDTRLGNVEDEVSQLGQKVQDLDTVLFGGKKYYANQEFDVQNTWVNYTNVSAQLSEIIDFPFKFKFSTPEGVNITSFGIRFYEEDGVTYHHYPASGLPNEDLEVTIPGGGNYKVSKISINQVTPDVRYTGEFGIKVWKEQDATLATKAELQAVADAVDFDERETIPDYYFANDYLDGKVTFIRNLLEGCMANGDAFFFQTDEHWEMNAQHSPALVKYIADRLNISRLFDGGDTTHNIDANGFHHTNPAAIDFNSLRAKTYKGNIFHTIGNHEYLTWAYTNIAQYSGVDFGNWHDFLYYQQPDRIVYGDSDKHYYYVNNYQKKIRYIFLSSYKKRETPIESGGKY